MDLNWETTQWYCHFFLKYFGCNPMFISSCFRYFLQKSKSFTSRSKNEYYLKGHWFCTSPNGSLRWRLHNCFVLFCFSIWFFFIFSFFNIQLQKKKKCWCKKQMVILFPQSWVSSISVDFFLPLHSWIVNRCLLYGACRVMGENKHNFCSQGVYRYSRNVSPWWRILLQFSWLSYLCSR